MPRARLPTHPPHPHVRLRSVSPTYVRSKLFMLLAPFLRRWSYARTPEQLSGGFKYLPPRQDVNAPGGAAAWRRGGAAAAGQHPPACLPACHVAPAQALVRAAAHLALTLAPPPPDLYIPLMAVWTYCILTGVAVYAAGTAFSPELIASTVSSAAGAWLAHTLLLKVWGGGQHAPVRAWQMLCAPLAARAAPLPWAPARLWAAPFWPPPPTVVPSPAPAAGRAVCAGHTQCSPLPGACSLCRVGVLRGAWQAACVWCGGGGGGVGGLVGCGGGQLHAASNHSSR